MATKTLTEYEAKRLLADYGVPVPREILAKTKDEALAAARQIGFPVVLKGSGASLTHKTELGLVRVGLGSEQQVAEAIDEWAGRSIPGLEGYLVQELVTGRRELICGLSQDPQFGPVIAFGMGGVQAEVVRDVVFRVCPITRVDALDMLAEIRGTKILDAFRGEPAADREALADVLLGVSRLAVERTDVWEIDLNPLVLREGRPVAVDALIGLR